MSRSKLSDPKVSVEVLGISITEEKKTLAALTYEVGRLGVKWENGSQDQSWVGKGVAFICHSQEGTKTSAGIGNEVMSAG